MISFYLKQFACRKKESKIKFILGVFIKSEQKAEARILSFK